MESCTANLPSLGLAESTRLAALRECIQTKASDNLPYVCRFLTRIESLGRRSGAESLIAIVVHLRLALLRSVAPVLVRQLPDAPVRTRALRLRVAHRTAAARRLRPI